MAAPLGDLFFGSIALKNRVLDEAQLAAALREQGARGDGATLGDICRELGYLTEEDVNAILWAQAKSEVLLEETLCGRIAVKNGLIAQADLDAALAEQKRRGEPARLGAILIERGKLTEQELAAILKAQKRLHDAGPPHPPPVISPPARPTIVRPAKAKPATPATPPARGGDSRRPRGRKKKKKKKKKKK